MAVKQNPVVLVILLLVIGVSLAFVVKAALPKRYQPKVDWACEACDHKFVARSQAKPMVCPKCKGEAVRVHNYYDTVNNEMFEAYRSKPNPEVTEGMDMLVDEMLYKMPGGKWTTAYPEKITSPKGVSDWSKLESCPPTSKRREGK